MNVDKECITLLEVGKKEDTFRKVDRYRVEVRMHKRVLRSCILMY